MGLPNVWGYFLFFAIPLALWTAGILSVKRRPFLARLFAFIAGGDNRLSLSRLQAFAWTLVIFGSFAAAMCVHTPISSGRDAGSKWVEIPPELLALAAIAIGSGVFSSLISVLGSEDKTACVTALQYLPPDQLQARFPTANAAAGVEPILIKGTDLGTSGRVRLGPVVAPILFWSGDEQTIVVDGSKLTNLKTLVVETSHGKLAYKLSGTPQQPGLGLPTFVYDPADLFRDDKDPSTFSLMKFQMFGWTIIAIVIYSWIFLTNLNPHISVLPNVDKTVVILTGLSQSGYLVGKAVGNAKSSDGNRS